MTAQLYAGWRFGLTPASAGWRTIDGIVLVDGAVDAPTWTSRLLPQYFRDKEWLEAGIVYWDFLAEGVSPLVGQIAEIAALAASREPTKESFLWQSLPAPFQWPDPNTCPTNKALFAALSDEQYGTNPTFRLHQGSLAVPVDLDRDGLPDRCGPPNQNRFLAHWRDFNETSPFELSSTDVWARTLWESRVTNGVEWYFSTVLNADIDLASNLDSRAPFRHPVTGKPTTAAELEGHRVFDTERVAVPVYAFVASECRDRFDWYQSVARSVPSFTLVDHSDEHCPVPSPEPYSHLDPLFAADTGGFTNAFLASLADWLRANR